MQWHTELLSMQDAANLPLPASVTGNAAENAPESSSDRGEGGVGAGVITGGVAAVVLVLVAMVVGIVLCLRRKKKKQSAVGSSLAARSQANGVMDPQQGANATQSSRAVRFVPLCGFLPFV